VRQLNPRCHIVVSGREDENLPLLRESGADAVVTSADAVGRLLGLSSVNPYVGTVVDARPADIQNERVLAVIRNDVLRNFYDPSVGQLQAGDVIVVVRKAVPRRHESQTESDLVR